ncbi:MAG TPA: hypothetical protein VK211_24100 [Kamptonema sp.]|nr:hypothetical protein [Kamptonema sp.]
MLTNAVVCYLIIALVVFKVWLEAFWGDTTTPKTNCISWTALILAPLLWPIVLPLSNFELAVKISSTIIDYHNNS